MFISSHYHPHCLVVSPTSNRPLFSSLFLQGGSGVGAGWAVLEWNWVESERMGGRIWMDICSVMANIRSKPATAGHPPGVQLFVMLVVRKLCPNLSWEETHLICDATIYQWMRGYNVSEIHCHAYHSLPHFNNTHCLYNYLSMSMPGQILSIPSSFIYAQPTRNHLHSYTRNHPALVSQLLDSHGSRSVHSYVFRRRRL